MTKPTPEPIDPGQLVTLAQAVMKADRFPDLATVDGDQPRVRPISPVLTEGFTVYVANLRAYRKTLEIAANPKVEPLLPRRPPRPGPHHRRGRGCGRSPDAPAHLGRQPPAPPVPSAASKTPTSSSTGSAPSKSASCANGPSTTTKCRCRRSLGGFLRESTDGTRPPLGTPHGFADEAAAP